MYCDFYSITDKSIMNDYVDALIRQIRTYKSLETDTVYIGGGTPTVLGEKLLDITDAVNECFVFAKNAEFTLEANPASADKALFSELYKRGVNRLSLGAQSFVDSELKALGRIHCAHDIINSVDMARCAGFKNISLDLMFAIPNQTIESLKYSIDCIKEIAPEHVSAYSLIVEEGTPFYNMELNLPSEDTERQMYYFIGEELEKEGYYRYEISNYAKKGFESRHNTGYWTGKEYLGLGAGAHSYFNGSRFYNESDIAKYIAGKGIEEGKTKISEKERSLEYFMLGLRMTEGVIYSGEFKDRVEPLIKKGLLEIKEGRLRLTKRGTDLANLVFMEFLND